MRNTATKRAGRIAATTLVAVAVSAAFAASSASALRWNEVPNGSTVPASLEGTLTLRDATQFPWQPGIQCTIETDTHYNQNGPYPWPSYAQNSAGGGASFWGRNLALCENGRRFGFVLYGSPRYVSGTLTPWYTISVPPTEQIQEVPYPGHTYYSQATTTGVPMTMGSTGSTGSTISFSYTKISSFSNLSVYATGTLEFKQSAGGTLTLSH